jgi:S-DNA-T family DNA segregation ATPase FtsK/SpoIIIE
MLLLLDWWEGYVAAFGEYDMGRLVESLLQVLREGSAVGLRAVVTTDRAALLGQIGTVFGRRMIFRLTDRSDCALAEIRERSLPAHQPTVSSCSTPSRTRWKARSRCSTRIR